MCKEDLVIRHVIGRASDKFFKFNKNLCFLVVISPKIDNFLALKVIEKRRYEMQIKN